MPQAAVNPGNAGPPGYSPLLYSSRMLAQERCNWQAPRTQVPGMAVANHAPAARMTERTLLGAEAPEATFSTAAMNWWARMK